MKRSIVDASRNTSPPTLTEQALQWLVDLHSGLPEAPGWESYLQWCDTSSDHQRAAHAAEKLWDSLGITLERPPSAARRLPQWGLAVVLSLAGALYWQAGKQGWMADQVTGLGEHRSLTLADGSRLELAPRTRVDIEMEADHRVVHLYAGELFVQVAPDAQRPFDVLAGRGRLRALGTGFDVRRAGEQVHMVVTEHSVRVSLEDDSQTVDVEAGQAVQYGPDGLSRTQPVDVGAATAWRRDRLVFNRQPLAQVLEQIGRYHRGLIWVRDNDLRQLPVTGVVATDDTDAQLQLLQRTLPLRVRQFPWLTVIERDDSRSK
ncbi:MULTISPECIES: FecR family protein [unclassified Pseudomonas]|uniref:FecR family protein n=1 Tax=unclassified Pseudomonas TaxID=196821 RepID=UPI0021158D5B|nr:MULTISPECIES: FecR family protein [unclassified Pseudomonas]MCU1733574.1 FecR family protein [Pseudomonas sp. 20P_3.2_Bac4]MCU1745848.1 FecR family protein [Pseudomonas sp. 20P_3.2_Bac5]